MVESYIMGASKERGAINMKVIRLNPVEFAKAMMKKDRQLIPTPIVLENGVAGLIYGYYINKNYYYLDRLDVDVTKKEKLSAMNNMDVRQEMALKLNLLINKNFVTNKK